MPTWYGSGKRKSQGIPSRGTFPYQKNDNRHVEQKNDTLVRQYLGGLRLDTPGLTLSMPFQQTNGSANLSSVIYGDAESFKM